MSKDHALAEAGAPVTAPPDDFPQLRQSLAALEPIFRESQALGDEPSRDQLAARQQWARVHLALDIAQAEVAMLYGSELLPALLGGRWQRTKAHITTSSSRYGGRAYPASDIRVLFDHDLTFRQHGARGPSTWNNCALIGRPYDVFSREGEVQTSALATAAELATRYQVGVWARRDLSTWYPGWTSLVVAAIGLFAENASRFGFIALNDLSSQRHAAAAA